MSVAAHGNPGNNLRASTSIERRLACSVPRELRGTQVGVSELEPRIALTALSNHHDVREQPIREPQKRRAPRHAGQGAPARGRQVGAHPPGAGPPSDTVGRALSSALAMHAVMPPTAAPAEPAGPLGKDKGWAEMSDGEKKAAGALGYDEASWEEGLVPEACTKRWETLEGTVKAAAVSLGYTQEEWDAELEPAADGADAAAMDGLTLREEAEEPRYNADVANGGAGPQLPVARRVGAAARARRRARGRRGARQGQGVGRHDGGRARRRGGHRLRRSAVGRGRDAAGGGAAVRRAVDRPAERGSRPRVHSSVVGCRGGRGHRRCRRASAG